MRGPWALRRVWRDHSPTGPSSEFLLVAGPEMIGKESSPQHSLPVIRTLPLRILTTSTPLSKESYVAVTLAGSPPCTIV